MVSLKTMVEVSGKDFPVNPFCPTEKIVMGVKTNTINFYLIMAQRADL